MRLIITIIIFFFISSLAKSSDNVYFKDCKLLHEEIELNIHNYFANLRKPSLRKHPDNKIRARNYLDIASKQANVYNAICDDSLLTKWRF